MLLLSVFFATCFFLVWLQEFAHFLPWAEGVQESIDQLENALHRVVHRRLI